MARIVNHKIIMNDKLHFGDIIASKGLWKKTEIIGGYGLRKNKWTGLSELNEELFRTHNTVPIGGVQYAMSQIFGVSAPITIPTLYDSLHIGLENRIYSDVIVPQPDGSYAMPYRYGNRVSLFGVGLAGFGGGENSITKYDVDYRENQITQTKQAQDGTTLDATMLPFRYTSTNLSTTEQLKYFAKTAAADGYYAYYLKRFEEEPIIHNYWNTTGTVDGSEDSATEVTDSDVWDATRTTPVQTLTEIQLRIATKDLKEFFNLDPTGQRIGDARFNVVGLFDADFDAESGDYRNVRLFSKLYIPTEPVQLSKDLELIYRVYGA